MARTETLTLLVAVALLAVVAGAARDDREPSDSGRHYSLEARLASSFAATEDFGYGGLAECWGALLELRACTNEIILFFLNGEGYLGQGCCRAIRIVTRQCWPSMLTSIGVTPEEGDMLADYCSIGEVPVLPPSPAPAPAPAPVDTAAARAH